MLRVEVALIGNVSSRQISTCNVATVTIMTSMVGMDMFLILLPEYTKQSWEVEINVISFNIYISPCIFSLS